MLEILILVVVIYFIYTKTKSKKESNFDKSINENIRKQTYPELNEMGIAELEAFYKNKKLDCFLKAKYFNRLVKWEAIEDPSLHWNGNHTIMVHTINGGFEKITVKITETGTTNFQIENNYTNPTDHQRPVSEENEKNIYKVTPELTKSDVDKNESMALPEQTSKTTSEKEKKDSLNINSVEKEIEEESSEKGLEKLLDENNIISYAEEHIAEKDFILINYSLLKENFDKEIINDELSLCGKFSDVFFKEDGILITK